MGYTYNYFLYNYNLNININIFSFISLYDFIFSWLDNKFIVLFILSFLIMLSINSCIYNLGKKIIIEKIDKNGKLRGGILRILILIEILLTLIFIPTCKIFYQNQLFKDFIYLLILFILIYIVYKLFFTILDKDKPYMFWRDEFMLIIVFIFTFYQIGSFANDNAKKIELKLFNDSQVILRRGLLENSNSKDLILIGTKSIYAINNDDISTIIFYKR